MGHLPFQSRGPTREDMVLKGVTSERLGDRRTLLTSVDRIRREILWRFMSNGAIERAFAAAHKFDLHTSAFVMFGLPTETRDDVMETAKLIARSRTSTALSMR